jgi:hypothetical protein
VGRSRSWRWWSKPGLAVEYGLEWVAYGLGRLAIFDVLSLVAQLGIVFGVVSYCAGGDQRQALAESQRQQKHFQAWLVINSAKTGQENSAGRIPALEMLAADGVSLARIDLHGADRTLEDGRFKAGSRLGARHALRRSA